MDELVQLLNLIGALAELLEDPVRSGLNQREGADAIGIGKRELDEGPPSARPSGIVRDLDAGLVQGQTKTVPLSLCGVGEISRLSRRAEFVVDRLFGQPFLFLQVVGMRNPRKPTREPTRNQPNGLSFTRYFIR